MSIRELGGWLLLLGALLLVAARIGYTREPTVTLRSTVSGNQQQPKVMYILPWQDPDDPLSDVQWRSLDNQSVFSPIYRSEFLRELDLRQQFVAEPTLDTESAITDIRNR